MKHQLVVQPINNNEEVWLLILIIHVPVQVCGSNTLVIIIDFQLIINQISLSNNY